MARVLAKSLNCLNADGPTTEPCCECDSCVSINSGDDIDVIEIDGASNNSVDNIRDLRENAMYRPARGRFKIYIIDEVHMLSASAFNALLKILEEPPSHIKFIFATTEPNKVLATIQSRCQRFDFRNISAGVIAGQLENVLKNEKVKYEGDVLVTLSRLANGSMRDGLSLLDRVISSVDGKLTSDLVAEVLGMGDHKAYIGLLGDIAKSDGAAVLGDISGLIDSGQSEVNIVEAMVGYLRDLLAVKVAPGNKELVVLPESQVESIRATAEDFDAAGIIYAITTLEKLRWLVKNSESARALLEAALVRLALSEKFIGIDSIIKHLQSGGGDRVKKNVPAGGGFEQRRVVERGRSGTTVARGGSESNTRQAGAVRFDGGDIIQVWVKLTEQLAERDTGLANSLSLGRVESFDNGVLRVVFPADKNFAMARCQAKGDKAKELLGEVVEGLKRVEFGVDKVGGSEVEDLRASGIGGRTGEKKTVSKSTSKAAGAKLSEDQRRKILSNPAVKTLMSNLDAKATDIKRV
jgi:DNA polymerase-3 subunit gamma/tau